MRDHLVPPGPSLADPLDDVADDPLAPTALSVVDFDLDATAETDRWTSDLTADRASARVEDEMKPLLDSLQRLRRRGLLD